jgi:long-chain fatty acid transport protein
LGLAICCGGAADAWASGFALHEQSAEGLGDAFAGQTAKAYDSSTVFYNPAGMARLDSNEVGASSAWIAPQAVFHGTNSSVLGGNVVGATGENAIKAAAIGSVYSVWNANPDWKLGLAVTTPFGMRSDYKENWVGRYQALASDMTDIDFAVAASYRVDDHLSVGGGPRSDYIKARLSEAINFQPIGLQTAAAAGAAAGQYAAAGQALLAAQSAALAANAQTWGDGLGKVEGDDFGYGYNLGALYEFNNETRVGLDYRSRVSHTLSGTVIYQTPSLLSAAGPAVAGQFANQNVTAKITLPDSLNFGFYHDVNSRLAIMSDIQWTHWSLFKELNVLGANGQAVSSTTEDWQNTWFLSLGDNYKLDDKWTLHSGIAFDETPVKTAYRTARIPDSNRYWLAVGASYSVTPAADVHLSYTHIFCDKASINESANQLAGVLTGSYDNSIDIASLSFAVRF